MGVGGVDGRVGVGHEVPIRDGRTPSSFGVVHMASDSRWEGRGNVACWSGEEPDSRLARNIAAHQSA